MFSLPFFGSMDLGIDWLQDNQALPAFFVVLFFAVVAISWKTIKTAAEDFMKTRPMLAAACLLAGILLYLNLLWLPPFLCVAAVIMLLAVPSLHRWPTRRAFAVAFAAYLVGYPLQLLADHLVHRLTWGAGSGLILLPQPNNPMLTTDEKRKDAFRVYTVLRHGLTASFLNVGALHIVPTNDPDEKAFGSTYATAAMRADRIEWLSRSLALSGQSLDIIIETDFFDSIDCGTRRWQVTLRPKIWHKDVWRPWSTGQIDPDAGWLLSSHPDMLVLDDEQQLLGLLAAYELARYFGSGRVVPLSHEYAATIWGNLVDGFKAFAFHLDRVRPLPPSLAQTIAQLDRNDPVRAEAALKDLVAFFQTLAFPDASTTCSKVEQATAISALGRQ